MFSFEALGSFPDGETPPSPRNDPTSTPNDYDLPFSIPFDRLDLFKRAAAGMHAEAATTPVRSVLTEAQQKEQADRQKVAEKKRDRENAADTATRKAHTDAARALLKRGLEEESPLQSSRYALKTTPKEFTHASLESKGKSVRFRDHQLHAVGKAHHVLNDPTIAPNAMLLNYGMGSGKTYIVHALMHLNKAPGTTMLLILPSAIITQWTRELDEKAVPALRYAVYGKEHLTPDQMMAQELVVTSYQMVLKDWTAQRLALDRMQDSFRSDFSLPPGETIRQLFPLFVVPFTYVWLDECHFVSNEEALTSQAVCDLACKKRFGCTGTPIQNDYHNIHALLRFLGVTPWNDSGYFSDVFLRKNKGETKAAKLGAGPNSFLAVSLRPYMLRLTTDDRFNGEPTVTFTKPADYEIRVQLNDEEQAVQDEVRYNWDMEYREEQDLKKANGEPYDSAPEADDWIAALGRARQGVVHPLLADPKYTSKGKKKTSNTAMDVLKADISGAGDLVEDLRPDKSHADRMLVADLKNNYHSTRIDYLVKHLSRFRRKHPGGKTLIFDDSARVLHVVSTALTANKIDHYFIHGNITKSDRVRMIDAFATGSIDVFLLTAGCGGTGIDQLAGAERVYIMTPSANPFLERQCIGRAAREGDKKQVKVFHFHSEDSIERRTSTLRDVKIHKSEHLFDPKNVSRADEVKLRELVESREFLHEVERFDHESEDEAFSDEPSEKGVEDDESSTDNKSSTDNESSTEDSDEDRPDSSPPDDAADQDSIMDDAPEEDQLPTGFDESLSRLSRPASIPSNLFGGQHYSPRYPDALHHSRNMAGSRDSQQRYTPEFPVQMPPRRDRDGHTYNYGFMEHMGPYAATPVQARPGYSPYAPNPLANPTQSMGPLNVMPRQNQQSHYSGYYGFPALPTDPRLHGHGAPQPSPPSAMQYYQDQVRYMNRQQLVDLENNGSGQSVPLFGPSTAGRQDQAQTPIEDPTNEFADEDMHED